MTLKQKLSPEKYQRVLELNRLSYHRRKHVLRHTRKRYYEKNKAKLMQQAAKYAAERKKRDPAYRILHNLRARLYAAFRNTPKSKRTLRTLELLGCTSEELKTYLESKFLPGMSWNLRGKIHVDHVIPCSHFDLSDPEQQKQCFHYTNLQLLWAQDNLLKSDKHETNTNHNTNEKDVLPGQACTCRVPDQS